MDLFRSTNVACVDLVKGPSPIRTGVGFLDHMVDQLNSHAQVGVGLTVHYATTTTTMQEEKKEDEKIDTNRNRLANVDGISTQSALMAHVGKTLGEAFATHLNLTTSTSTTSRFCCPLDEALVECTLTTSSSNSSNASLLVQYELAPYGKFPKTGRSHIGQMETHALFDFWSSLAKASGLSISMKKIRGDNAHHIVEASFKAFSRALRNLLDGTTTITITTNPMYAWSSENGQASIALQRQGKVERSTKETRIHAHLQLNGGTNKEDECGGGGGDIINVIDTGITDLNDFLTTLSQAAEWSLKCTCQGDLWVDEHHTAEDVAIALGQVLCQAMGNKAGLNRMWCARVDHIEVTVDLSNRPCLTHNLCLEEEFVGDDLTVEMFDHVLDSFVVNGRMTVHIVQDDLSCSQKSVKETVQATAQAFGQALKYCLMVDCRRAGQTASSKGTLSV